MGKYDGYLICSDCDGTLTNDKLEVSNENKNAIRYFQENGGIFTISTGRFPEYIEKVCADFMPNAPIISSNGVALYDLSKKEIVSENLFTGDAEEIITFVFDTLPTVREISLGGRTENIGCYVRSNYTVEEELDSAFENFLPVNSAKEIIDDYRFKNQRLGRMFFVQDKEDTESNYAAIKARFSELYTIVTGWECGIECLPKNCTKGDMVKTLKKILGDKIHTTICIGDYENDISMFKIADIGIATDNAPDFVKKYAHKLTVSCNDSAIAKVISEIK